MDAQTFEPIVSDLCQIFEVHNPPVPIETMLSSPPAGLWNEVDIRNLSGSFLKYKPGEPFSPRMSIARLLIRHMCTSEWGAKNGMGQDCNDKTAIHLLSLVIVMPKFMIDEMPSSSRNPKTIGMHFEVPEEDARTRLLSLAEYD